MRRRLTLAATWVAATVLATFVVSLGVRVVTSEVTTRRPAPLALVRAAVSTTSTTTTSTTTTSTTVAPTTSTTAPRPTTTAARRPAPTTTTVPATVRTANGRGGSVTVRFTPGAVTLVVATPAPGYAVHVGDDGPRFVSVRFRSDRHDTVVFARAGEPRVVVAEDDDHHGGDDGGFGGGGPGHR